MKRIVIILIAVVLLLPPLSYWAYHTQTKQGNNQMQTKSSEAVQADEAVIAASSTVQTSQILFDKDGSIYTKELYVAGKQVVDLTYPELIKLWGKPVEIKSNEVRFPGTIEQHIVYVLCYNGIEIEMYPVAKGVAVENTTSFRFDIIDSDYIVAELQVGMEAQDFFDRFGERQLYTLTQILSEEERHSEAISLRKLLTDLKPSDYYSSYGDKVFYIGGALLDDKNSIKGAIGFAVIVKDSKITRVIYGLPTAG